MKPTKERVRELLSAGLKPKVIAEGLGIKPATVYTYRYMFKKEEIKSYFRDLEKKNDENKKLAKELEKENQNLNESLAGLEETVKILQEENEKLRIRNNELIDEAREQIEAYEKQYRTEKSKHDTLFSYLMLDKEVV